MARMAAFELPDSWSRLLQDPADGEDGVPIPRGDGYAEQFVDLAQVGDGFHVAAVFGEEEAVLRGDHAHEPWTAGRQRTGNGRETGAGLGEDAYEADDIRAGWCGCEPMVRFQA